ncbi:MAG: rRNA maturation RNase YbeY [Rikenellaceae bacterium]|nr:rRNA maturation RNase YbeY [Rikenellaceae bacterium]
MVPQVGFHNEGTPYRLRGKRAVSAWVGRCIEIDGYRAGEINFIFCSGEKHLGINRTYLGHDHRTDVITFDYTDTDTGIVGGDIFIDPETVRRNARHYGVTARCEMLRVIIHGILHLCGYNDKTEKEKSRMREKEDDCLRLFGISDITP